MGGAVGQKGYGGIYELREEIKSGDRYTLDVMKETVLH